MLERYDGQQVDYEKSGEVVPSNSLPAVDDLKVLRHVGSPEDKDHVDEEARIYGPIDDTVAYVVEIEAELQRNDEATVDEHESDEDVPSVLNRVLRVDNVPFVVFGVVHTFSADSFGRLLILFTILGPMLMGRISLAPRKLPNQVLGQRCLLLQSRGPLIFTVRFVGLN